MPERDSQIREGLCDTIMCFTCILGTDPEIYVSERLLSLSHSRQNTGLLARRRETWKLIARAWTLAWWSPSTDPCLSGKTCVLEQAPNHYPLQSPFVFFLTLITGWNGLFYSLVSVVFTLLEWSILRTGTHPSCTVCGCSWGPVPCLEYSRYLLNEWRDK